MRRELDRLSKKILDLLAKASEPLETKEIELELKKETRVKILYRLNFLRGEGLLKGKAVGSGKGSWIWWRKEVFKK
jgi:repressor of nif and glnA expression